MIITMNDDLPFQPPQFNNYPSFTYMRGKKDIIQFGNKIGDECVMYVHLPFCLQKCAYCTLSDLFRSTSELVPVIDSMKREILMMSGRLGDRRIKAVLLGGGTPTNLDVEQINDLYGCLRRSFNFTDDAEVTVEARPESLSREKIEAFKNNGVNRLSFGVQSLDPEELRLCGRKNTADVLLRAMDMSREVGLENINFDFILGLPAQTGETFSQTCETIFGDLRPNHASIYLLMVHPQTGFERLKQASGELFPSLEDNRERYHLFFDIAERNGYIVTSAENVSLKASQYSHYQRLNWNGYERIAIGPDAIGYIGGTQYANLGWKQGYKDEIFQGRFPIDRSMTINDDELLRRRIILGLHNLRLDLSQIDKEYGVDTKNIFAKEFGELERRGLIKVDNSIVELLPEGRKYLFYSQCVFENEGKSDRQRGRAAAGDE